MTHEELSRLKTIIKKMDSPRGYSVIITGLHAMKEDYPSIGVPWDDWIELVEALERDALREAQSEFSEIRIDFG